MGHQFRSANVGLTHGFRRNSQFFMPQLAVAHSYLHRETQCGMPVQKKGVVYLFFVVHLIRSRVLGYWQFLCIEAIGSDNGEIM